MSNVDTEVDTKVVIKEPTLYKAILLNDDYTPMEFVMQVMLAIFHKTPEEAYQLTMDIHQDGRGICGIYTKEIAQTKVTETIEAAKKNGYPLRAIIEPA